MEELANVFPEQTVVNKHAIELEKGKQPPYGRIQSLGLVELKTFNTYIKTILANSFIKDLKLPLNALILFERKSDGSLYLCVNYWGPNNLTIKNCYPLPLIGESPNRLGQVKPFTYLNFKNVYHQMKIKKRDK